MMAETCSCFPKTRYVETP